MLRNLAAQKEQGSHHQVTPDSVYDKLRMFNGQAASWAWYGATPSATHLGLPTGPPTHPALSHPFQANREILEDKKPGTVLTQDNPYTKSLHLISSPIPSNGKKYIYQLLKSHSKALEYITSLFLKFYVIIL